jgi:ATP-binding cassette subfamily E protein 1
MPAKRLATIDRELCNPKKTGYACRKVCPVNRAGQDCITVSEQDQKPLIDEDLCIGCGLCVKRCDRRAIRVVNLAAELEEMPIHRYGRNMFTLFGLPFPKRNAVVGLIGQNGMGKSTVLNVMSGNLRPNTGLPGREVPWDSIIARFKGTELQGYLESLSRGGIRTSYKPQQVDLIPRQWKGQAGRLLEGKADSGRVRDLAARLGLQAALGKDVASLSGGELQLLAIAAAMLKDADFYFFDEPSSYLDAYQRLRAAREIRALAGKAVVIVIEHDLAVADYLADFVHILYGTPGVFGVVSRPFGVRVGINAYLEGYMREENVRFREEAVTFGKQAKTSLKDKVFLEFPGFAKKLGAFGLRTAGGSLYRGEVVGVLGPNAIGKTTFIRMLAGEVKPDEGDPLRGLRLSYKPQRMALSGQEASMAAGELLARLSGRGALSTEDKTVLRTLGVERLLERTARTLSGGELQSLMVAAGLLKDADLLLLDEPSAFLDVEQRLRAAKLIRQHVESRGVTCFVVDHDLQFIDSISDRVMVFEGEPGVRGEALPPEGLKEGMNRLLRGLGVTYRRDPVTGRPRANKPGSQKDQEQRESGEYYYAG